MRTVLIWGRGGGLFYIDATECSWSSKDYISDNTNKLSLQF